MDNSPIHIVVAEDQIIFSEGIRMLFQGDPKYHFLGSHVNARELIDSSDLEKSDVVLMDINMPIMNGIDGCIYIHEHYPDKKILMLSMYGSQELILDVINAGASGYLLKNTSKAEIEKAIQAVFNNEVYFSKNLITYSRKQKPIHRKSDDVQRNIILTKREKQILKLVDKSPSAISVELGLNLKLVYLYIQNLFKKFNVNSQHELLELVMQSKV